VALLQIKELYCNILWDGIEAQLSWIISERHDGETAVYYEQFQGIKKKNYWQTLQRKKINSGR
jgi:hypothetical protein